MRIFAAALAILFIGLKLADVITWNWGWVLAPLWGPVILVALAYLILGEERLQAICYWLD